MKATFLIMLLFLMGRCIPDGGNVRNYDYTIINSSGKTVTFIPYINSVPDLNKQVVLQNGQSLNKKETVSQYNVGFAMGNVLFGSNVPNLTHIELIFDNHRKTLYPGCTLDFNCNQNPRNIMNSSNNESEIETYTITPENYQNAVDCGGSCY